MKNFKKIIAVTIAISVLFSMLASNIVSADDTPLYDYSSYVGTWGCENIGDIEIIGATQEYMIINMGGIWNNKYPISDNKVVIDSSKKMWKIIYTLTFFDDSIQLISDTVNPEGVYTQNIYWLNSSAKPRHIETGNYSVLLNGNYLEFDTPPVMSGDRILVPMRKIFESLGSTVDYLSEMNSPSTGAPAEETISITAVKDNMQLELSRTFGAVWSYALYENNEYVKGEFMDSENGYIPPIILNDRTLVPVRFVSETLGANVDWDESTQTVIIDTNKTADNIHSDAPTGVVSLDSNDNVSVSLAFGGFPDDTTDWNANAREAALAVKKYGIEQGYSDMYDIYDVTVYAGYYEIRAGHSYYGDEYLNNMDIFYSSWEDCSTVSMDFSDLNI